MWGRWLGGQGGTQFQSPHCLTLSLDSSWSEFSRLCSEAITLASLVMPEGLNEMGVGQYSAEVGISWPTEEDHR